MRTIPILAVLIIPFMLSCRPTEESKREIIVRSDKNLEVLFTVYNQIWTPFLDPNVSNRMLEHSKLMQQNHQEFVEFNDHKAIELTEKILGRSGTDFFLLAFFYDEFPKVKRIKEIPDRILKDINQDTDSALFEIEKLMQEISVFYMESNFEAFYERNQYVYNKAIDEVTKNLPGPDFIPFMESYFGHKFKSYNFLILPFFKSEFGMAFPANHGSDSYCLVSSFEPAKLDSNNQVVYVGYDSPQEILEWVTHEYAHNFFNPPLFQPENVEKLDTYGYLFQPIKGSPQIANWASMFAEHLAVAFEVRAADLIGDSVRVEQLMDSHKDWPYISHFVQQLRIYENNRSKYKDIDSFIPSLIDSLKNLD
ncbi:MAG: DUF4932 domain-containing protein [Cyclobacteriaceae bacterium]